MIKDTIIVGIAGASASGKSVLARTIAEEVGEDHVIVIPQDCYYKNHPDLSFSEREKINYDHPDAFDTEFMIKQLKSLRKGKTVEVPKYDYETHRRTEATLTIKNYRIIILEGILLFVEPRLRDLMDIRIFMDTAPDICLIRRLQRDMELRGRSLTSILEQYAKTVRPMYYQFIEPSRKFADIIVPRGGENRIAIDMIKAKMHNLIKDSTSVTQIKEDIEHVS